MHKHSHREAREQSKQQPCQHPCIPFYASRTGWMAPLLVMEEPPLARDASSDDWLRNPAPGGVFSISDTSRGPPHDATRAKPSWTVCTMLRGHLQSFLTSNSSLAAENLSRLPLLYWLKHITGWDAYPQPFTVLSALVCSDILWHNRHHDLEGHRL